MQIALKLFIFIIGLVIPGAGFSITNRPWSALAASAVGLVWVVFISLTRLVTIHTGFYALLMGLLAIHISSIMVSGVWLFKYRRQRPAFSLTLSSLITCILLFIGMTFSVHKLKASWLGFELYQIPSVSMAPTLRTGDVILVDTWAYKRNTPAPNDIVVFKRNKKSAVLIKRVNQTRKTEKGIEIWVLGDNAARSQDSRTFGWVQTEYLLGKSKLVWFNLSSLFNATQAQ